MNTDETLHDSNIAHDDEMQCNNTDAIKEILHQILATRLKMTKSLQQLNTLARTIPQHLTLAPYLKLSPHLYDVLEHQNLQEDDISPHDASPIGAYVEKVLALLDEAEHASRISNQDSLQNTTTTTVTTTTTSSSPTHLQSLHTGGASDHESFESIWQHIGPDWPRNSVPIRCDVTTFEWDRLARFIQFDVVMMDPPWQLASSNPTRGVALAYAQLSDSHIQALPMHLIAKPDSFLFLWVINAKYQLSLQLIREWGYTFVDEITWVKHTKNRRLAKSHGYYLQHAKESCLVAVRGNPRYNKEAQISDIIFSERRAQSQKPSEIYSYIEELVPNGKFLEIFGRKNNLRSGWITAGNEI